MSIFRLERIQPSNHRNTGGGTTDLPVGCAADLCDAGHLGSDQGSVRGEYRRLDHWRYHCRSCFLLDGALSCGNWTGDGTEEGAGSFGGKFID